MGELLAQHAGTGQWQPVRGIACVLKRVEQCGGVAGTRRFIDRQQCLVRTERMLQANQSCAALLGDGVGDVEQYRTSTDRTQLISITHQHQHRVRRQGVE